MNDEDVEREWKDFWEPIVAPEGKLDLEQLKKELYDFRVVMQEVEKVYIHVTGGKLSKCNVAAQHVIDEYEKTFDEFRKKADAYDRLRENREPFSWEVD